MRHPRCTSYRAANFITPHHFVRKNSCKTDGKLIHLSLDSSYPHEHLQNKLTLVSEHWKHVTSALLPLTTNTNGNSTEFEIPKHYIRFLVLVSVRLKVIGRLVIRCLPSWFEFVNVIGAQSHDFFVLPNNLLIKSFFLNIALQQNVVISRMIIFFSFDYSVQINDF